MTKKLTFLIAAAVMLLTMMATTAMWGQSSYELYSGNLAEGDYIIYYSGKAMKNTISSNRLGYVEVTPSNFL